MSEIKILDKAGELIGLKDSNGNDIFIGAVIQHNENLYLIKWSRNRKEIVARAEPLKGQEASWRKINWIKNLSDKYIKMVGTVLFNDENLKSRFKDVF